MGKKGLEKERKRKKGKRRSKKSQLQSFGGQKLVVLPFTVPYRAILKGRSQIE